MTYRRIHRYIEIYFHEFGKILTSYLLVQQSLAVSLLNEKVNSVSLRLCLQYCQSCQFSHFVVKTKDFVAKMKDFVAKTKDFVAKTKDFW